MPGSPIELTFSIKAGGKVVSMPKMIPIFFTNTPSLGNTNPAVARLPLLLENPKTGAGSAAIKSFFILCEKGGFVSGRAHPAKRYGAARYLRAGYNPHKIFLYPTDAPPAGCE